VDIWFFDYLETNSLSEVMLYVDFKKLKLRCALED